MYQSHHTTSRYLQLLSTTAHVIILIAVSACGGAGTDTPAAESSTDAGATTSGTATESAGDGDGDGDGTETCGDGIVTGSEECDDGNPTNTDMCTNDCRAAVCGDSFVFAGVEECDDGNGDDSDMCTSMCELASCDDGLHNGAETDTDCGGPCMPCSLGAACIEEADCETTLLCTDAVCSHPETCANLHARLPLLPSGAYWIDIDGHGAREPIEVRCEMEIDGGGWTLLQRTVWEPAETLALRTDYETWRTTTVGAVEPGRGYRMAGMDWERFNETKDHLLVHYLRNAGDLQSCDPLYYKGTGGDLNVGVSTTYLTGLMSSVQMTNNLEMSTTSSGPAQHCVNAPHLAVPWFHLDCCATCPTFQGSYWPEPHPTINYSETPDLFGNTRLDVCEGGEAVLSLFGESDAARGVNTMEYYIR